MVTMVTRSAEAPIERSSTVDSSCKRRRAILRDLSEDDDSSSSENGGTPTTSLSTPLPCIIDGDANLMDADAEKCTYLNSDEDPDEAE
ncbi:unnamed protein product [Phytophthora fragariaefolia]|uniref:Unnamed protein product n=1 Tax=Phytophthora fragariaefolia TaxID=1490495 RepID=A0A9W6XR36_9STRA|nr:unnamed protein product [Phytophthora fragariaefolia]